MSTPRCADAPAGAPKAAKTVVKRLTAWYLKYLGDQVSDLRTAIVHLGEGLAERVDGVREEVDDLRDRVEAGGEAREAGRPLMTEAQRESTSSSRLRRPRRPSGPRAGRPAPESGPSASPPRSSRGHPSGDASKAYLFGARPQTPAKHGPLYHASTGCRNFDSLSPGRTVPRRLPQHHHRPLRAVVAAGHRQQRLARRQLAQLAPAGDLQVAHSHFSGRDLGDLGFPAPRSCRSSSTSPSSTPHRPAAAGPPQAGGPQGRCPLALRRAGAPNKCHHDLIGALPVYRAAFDPRPPVAGRRGHVGVLLGGAGVALPGAELRAPSSSPTRSRRGPAPRTTAPPTSSSRCPSTRASACRSSRRCTPACRWSPTPPPPCPRRWRRRPAARHEGSGGRCRRGPAGAQRSRAQGRSRQGGPTPGSRSLSLANTPPDDARRPPAVPRCLIRSPPSRAGARSPSSPPVR